MMVRSAQAFPSETREKIAREFRGYFSRKKKIRLSARDAKMMIDNIAGPVSAPHGISAQDCTRPRVVGGGARRPTDAQVAAMVERHRPEEPDDWDAVFDEVMRRCQNDRCAEKLILTQFRDGCAWYIACDELGIGTNKYYAMKNGILDLAGVIAVKMGLLDPWKY